MVTISRQDMSNWQRQVYDKVRPLFALLKETLRQGPVIQMDETSVQVMGEEGRSGTQQSYMLLARGGPPDKTVVLYQYRQTHGAYHAKEILEGYSGFLQTDGYAAYDCAFNENKKIIQAGCFAHARRKFFEASKVKTRAQTAEEGIKFIKKLYIIESKLRNEFAQDNNDNDAKKSEKRENFKNERKKQVLPVFDEFKKWLIKTEAEVPESTLLGKAVSYALNQWDKLVMYIESPYLTPDNNASENAIRPFVIGRKNWLFCQSPDGAESSCGMYTLIQTAKQNGVEPFRYLKALFEKAPFAAASEDWENLLPWNIFIS